MRAVRKSYVYMQLAGSQGAAAAEHAVPGLLGETAEKFTVDLWDNRKFFGDLLDARASHQVSVARAPHQQVNEGLIPKRLQIKVEAQVMLLMNLEQDGGTDRMLVNGSRGVVSRVQPIDAIIRERQRQLKAMRGGDVRADTRDQAAPSDDNYDRRGWDDEDDGTHLPPAEAALVEQIEKLVRYEQAGFSSLPYVDFWNGRTDVLIEPHTFESEVPGRGKCTRLQLPLKLAWSITIHKSQGLTIEAVRMDLSRCRTPGQAYVALSRASSVSGLELLRPIDPRNVATDPIVGAFYRALRAGEKKTEAWFDRCKRWWEYPVGEKVAAASTSSSEGRGTGW